MLATEQPQPDPWSLLPWAAGVIFTVGAGVWAAIKFVLLRQDAKDKAKDDAHAALVKQLLDGQRAMQDALATANERVETGNQIARHTSTKLDKTTELLDKNTEATVKIEERTNGPLSVMLAKLEAALKEVAEGKRQAATADAAAHNAEVLAREVAARLEDRFRALQERLDRQEQGQRDATQPQTQTVVVLTPQPVPKSDKDTDTVGTPKHITAAQPKENSHG